MPLQVKSQLPWLQLRFAFGPTVKVQDVPLQMTEHVSPQVPEHVDPVSQVNAHDEVLASHGDFVQLPLSAHVQE